MEKVTETGKVDCSIKKRLVDVLSGFSSFAKGDVVVAKITPCFENGKGACMDVLDTEVGFGTTEFINLRPSERVLPKFLYMITMTRPFRKRGEKSMTGTAGQKRIPADYIRDFTLGIPPIEEQYAILDKIELKLKQIDELIKVENESIKGLQDLKDCLIADTVTGKIDVRNVTISDYEPVTEDTADATADSEADEPEEQE